MRSFAGLVIAVAACAAPVLASGSEDLAAALRACRAEADDARRLACYDRAAGRAGEAAEPAPAPAATAGATAAAPAAAVARPEDNFGRERQLAREEDKKREAATRAVGELRAAIVSIEKRIDGLMTFTLDNGQVWRQNRPDSMFSIKQGDAVLIQPGSLNSFILSGPNKKSTRVTRIK